MAGRTILILLLNPNLDVKWFMAKKRINNINNYFARLNKVATNNEENRSCFVSLTNKKLNYIVTKGCQYFLHR